jgi:hypothetical protein
MTIQDTLVFSALFALLAAGIYAYIGWRLSRRIVDSPEGRVAWRSFTIWWYGLAVTTCIRGLLNLFGAFGLTNLPLFVTATYINLQVSCLALCGLFYYLIYLFTGQSRWLKPLALLYIVSYVVLVYYVTASDPVSVSLERWSAELAYRIPFMGPFVLILVILLFGSQIIGGLAYFTLYFRVRDVTQKYRILLVSWSIILWFLSPFAAIAAGLEGQDWWQLASRLIGLTAALTILMAYLPPRWLKQRYGIASLSEENLKS